MKKLSIFILFILPFLLPMKSIYAVEIISSVDKCVLIQTDYGYAVVKKTQLPEKPTLMENKQDIRLNDYECRDGKKCLEKIQIKTPPHKTVETSIGYQIKGEYRGVSYFVSCWADGYFFDSHKHDAWYIPESDQKYFKIGQTGKYQIKNTKQKGSCFIVDGKKFYIEKPRLNNGYPKSL